MDVIDFLRSICKKKNIYLFPKTGRCWELRQSLEESLIRKQAC